MILDKKGMRKKKEITVVLSKSPKVIIKNSIIEVLKPEVIRVRNRTRRQGGAVRGGYYKRKRGEKGG